MDKDKIERKVKIEIEFFRIYSFFIFGLVTGIYGIFINGIYKWNYNAFLLLIIGVIFLIFFCIMFLNSYFKLKKLWKQ